MKMLFSGRRFYAHRIALLASSDAFRAMFDGGYRVSFQPSIVCAACFIVKLPVSTHIKVNLGKFMNFRNCLGV
jgi:hypothetical protein